MSIEFTSLEQFEQHLVMTNSVLGTDKATFNPSVKGCRWCRAAGSCKALALYNLNKARSVFSDELVVNEDDLRDTGLLTPEQLSELLKDIDLMSSWIKEVRKRAFTLLEDGESLPDFKLVEGRTQRAWRDADAVKALLGEELGEDLYDLKIKSPAQVEKMLGRKEFSQLVGELVYKPPGKKTLASADDKRAALSGDVADVFAD